MPPVVWLAEVPFGGAPHRQVYLARLLSQHRPVVYVEPPPSGRLPRLGLHRRGGVLVAQVAPILNARPVWIRAAVRQRRWRRLAAGLASAQLRLAIARARGTIGDDAPTVVCSTVFLAHAAAALRPAKLVVDICDDPRHYPGEPPWTHDLLVAAIRSADLVTTSSLALREEFLALGARCVEHVPNGIRAAWLEGQPARQRVQAGPVVGFLGHIGPWVDLGLLSQLARALPEVRVDLVGSVDPACRPRLEQLLVEPNVRYQGPVNEEEVPAALARFDLGLIPFEYSAYTRAVNPLKLYEYAASDLPIVATAFSPDLEPFRGSIAVCASAAEFIDAARRAPAGSRPSTRWIAEAHTWERIASRFACLLGR